ncbi:MAG TPA: hypothetical protein VGZ29_06775 [Terriglobia bacterium]|nr:hypothetical protein [Terriglobia bacterium]
MSSQDVKRSCAAARPDEGRDVLSLGKVTVIGPTTCPQGAATGALCKEITVSCPGLPNLNAILGAALPTGPAKGTIVLVIGGPGTSFLNAGFADPYVTDGFQVVQLAWASDWAVANGAGVRSAACRPATVFKYVFNTVHGASRTTGFCGQGISGGGAALAYSLADYGFSNYFDYVVIASGPGVSRMDYGCDPKLYTGSSRDLCPLLTGAPFTYEAGIATKVNNWENTTTCGLPSPSQSDIDKWAADSIVSAGSSYSYPNTGVSWFYCATAPYSFSTGQGSFLVDQIVAKNFPSDVNCYSGICQGEGVWNDPNAFSTTQSEMLSQCVPNH